MLFDHYTGKYWCQYTCHSKLKSIIPARILWKWDFKQYPVSNFSFNSIQSMKQHRLIDVSSFNHLYRKSRSLNRIMEIRSQLVSLKSYIQSCNRAGNILLSYLCFEFPKDLVIVNSVEDVHIYSLDELIMIHMNPSKIIAKMNELVNLSVAHVSSCSLCQAKGFICEVCIKRKPSSKDPTTVSKRHLIFPFESGRVKQCLNCGSCYHLKCFTKCLKCERKQIRKSSLFLNVENHDQELPSGSDTTSHEPSSSGTTLE